MLRALEASEVFNQETRLVSHGTVIVRGAICVIR